MCGIAGFSGDGDEWMLRGMADRMSHRGPDDTGTWIDQANQIGMAHRRLSIIDLSRLGRQPMSIDGESLTIVYNGEIYDFETHKKTLEGDGVGFSSKTDTEVILRLYQRLGLDALRLLNGMFAFALWDRRRKRLILARDHAGIKPLYYYIDGANLYFASEIKALFAVPAVPNSLDHAALSSYLRFLWVPGPETLFRGIRKLEPGCVLVWEQGRAVVRRWFEIEHVPDQRVSEREWIEETAGMLRNAVRRQMVADVPLGSFLSGGLDSSSIVACMREAHPERRILAYTARSAAGHVAAEQGDDDLPYAQRVAEHLGADLRTVDVEPDVVTLLPKMVYSLDEPDADPAVFPTYLISSLARDEGVKVLLSGTGGDELFFGYRSHQAFAVAERLGGLGHLAGAGSGLLSGLASLGLGTQHRVARRLRKLSLGLSETDDVKRHLALSEWSGSDSRAALLGDAAVRVADDHDLKLFQRIASTFRGEGMLNLHSHLLINTFLASHNFLYTDRASMAASLEVRVPFLDIELLRLCARMPQEMRLRGTTTKYVLKRAMEKLLPRDVIYRPKTGFGAPLRRWISKDLRQMVHELLGPKAIAKRELFSKDAVAEIIRSNEAGRGDHAYLIYALLNLEIWMRTFVDRRAVPFST